MGASVQLLEARLPQGSRLSDSPGFVLVALVHLLLLRRRCSPIQPRLYCRRRMWLWVLLHFLMILMQLIRPGLDPASPAKPLQLLPGLVRRTMGARSWTMDLGWSMGLLSQEFR